MKWQKLQSRDQIPLLLNGMGLVGEAVEVGVCQGWYSQLLLQRWNGKKLWLVDCWEQQDEEIYKDPANKDNQHQQCNMEETISRIGSHWGRTSILQLFSEQAVKLFEDKSLDFIYIDANHHTGIKKDLEIWYPKVKPGGIFAGHDYFDTTNRNTHCTVAPAVDQFFNDKEQVFPILSVFCSSIDSGGNAPGWLVMKK